MDGIRGLAIGMVLLFHFVWGQAGPLHGTLWHQLAKSTRLLWSGVDCFFVLSGFLIGGILVDNRAANNYFTVFYLRRAFRILPAFWLLIASYVVAQRVVEAGPAASVWREMFANPVSAAWYASFLNNFVICILPHWGSPWMAVTWSLAIEEQFYLVLPALIRWLPRRHLPGAIALVFAAAPVLRLLIWLFAGNVGINPRTAAFVLLPCRMDALATGVAIALAWRNDAFRAWCRANQVVIRSLLGMLVVGAASLTVGDRGSSSELMVAGGGLTLLALLFGALLLLSLISDSCENRVFRSWPLRWLGVHCYSLYLFHSIVMFAAHAWVRDAAPALDGMRGLWTTAVGVAGVIAVAGVIYRAVELPCLRAGWRWKYSTGG